MAKVLQARLEALGLLVCRSATEHQAMLRIAAALTVGALASWRLWFEPGVVSLLHDWAIAPFAPQLVLYAKMMFHGWFNGALGSPFVYPSDYPIRWALAGLGALGIGGGPISKSVVFLVPAVSFLTASYMCRLLFRNIPASWAGGLFYALNPVVLNKLASGQLAYLVAYPTLPLCLGLAYAGTRAKGPQSLWEMTRKAAATAALLSIVSGQIQLGFAAVIAVVLITLTAPKGPGYKALFLAIIGVVFAACQLPVAVGVLHGSASVVGRAGFVPTLEELLGQSISLDKVFRLTGYIANYMSFAVIGWYPQWELISWLAAIAAIAGLLLARARLRVVAVPSLLVLFVFLSGAKGPAAPLFIWLFRHVGLMQTFRELYHLMAAVALLYAVGVASLVAWLIRPGPTVLRVSAGISVVAVTFIYGGVPIASGDCGGWLHAFPLDSTYQRAFVSLEQGRGRLLWLPMDQPLAFDGVGFGGDPLGGVAQRGSMPTYALDWPLNALDYDVRTDSTAFRALAQALGITTVAQRGRLRSQLERFTLDPVLARHFFSSPFVTRSLGRPTERIGDTIIYSLKHALPVAYQARMIALAPTRASVAALLMMRGFAPVSYTTALPASVPYAIFYDPNDIVYEALDFAHDAVSPTPFKDDARQGFALGQAWWWYRREYADTPSFILAIGRQNLRIPHGDIHHAKLVLGWISTPAGGRLRIDVGRSKRFVIDTRSDGRGSIEGPDHSVVLTLGDVKREEPVILSAVDPYSEIALRGYGLLTASELERDLNQFSALLGRARQRVPLLTAFRLLPAGTVNGKGPALPHLIRGDWYTLHVQATPKQQLALTDADTRLDAAFRFSDGFASTRFQSDGLRLSIIGVSLDQKWSLTHYRTVAREYGGIPAPATKGTASSIPVVVYNVLYSRRWSIAGAAAHVRSLIGTNVFIGARRADPVDTAAASFMAAFSAATAVLLAGLACLLLDLRRRNA